MSDSSRHHGLQPTRLLHPWDFPGKSTGVGCHCLLRKSSLSISNFLEEISSLSHSIVFLYFFALITEEGFFYLFLLFFGTLHSNGYIFPFLVCFSLLFFSQLFVRFPQTTVLLFCISFSWGWSYSLSPVQCHEPLSIVHQALCLQIQSLKSISDFHPLVNMKKPLNSQQKFWFIP